MVLAEQAVILLVEDREDDVLLVRRALRLFNPFFIVRNGEDALAYLEGVGKYGNRDEYPLPHIMLLDLKMPRMDGFEVLRAVRGRPEFDALRIIVLTSSEDQQDVNKAYDLGANSFVVKPSGFDQYATMLGSLMSFWLNHSVNADIYRKPVTETAPLLKNNANGQELS